MKTECETCGGKGRLYTDHFTFVAPRDDGLCEECNGTGWLEEAWAWAYFHDGQMDDEAHPIITRLRWPECFEPWTEVPLYARRTEEKTDAKTE